VGHGITVHRRNCINALKISPERQVPVSWHSVKTDNYPVRIKVISHDKIGLLGDITTNISKNGANITDAKLDKLDNNMYQSCFTIGVKDVEHLKNVITGIKKLKFVTNVIRVKD
jgi:GTP pyrophosphokinase